MGIAVLVLVRDFARGSGDGSRSFVVRWCRRQARQGGKGGGWCGSGRWVSRLAVAWRRCRCRADYGLWQMSARVGQGSGKHLGVLVLHVQVWQLGRGATGRQSASFRLLDIPALAAVPAVLFGHEWRSQTPNPVRVRKLGGGQVRPQRLADGGRLSSGW